MGLSVTAGTGNEVGKDKQRYAEDKGVRTGRTEAQLPGGDQAEEHLSPTILWDSTHEVWHWAQSRH